jgi:allophanate hydrolase subunit 1
VRDGSIPAGEVRRLGDRAFLIGVPDAAAARWLAGELTASFGAAAEVVGGATSVMVHVIDGDTDHTDHTDTNIDIGNDTALEPLVAIAQARGADVAGRHPSDRSTAAGRLVTIPCRFDGPDLHEVAARSGCRPDEVVTLLTAHPLTASVIGFSPGFAYLDGLPTALGSVPRRARPRPARWRSPTVRPPSIRRRHRVAGSWWGAPPSRCSRPCARRTPCWHRATRSA